MARDSFVHLHLHTEYSLLGWTYPNKGADGKSRPPSLIMELPDELCYEDIAWSCAEDAREESFRNEALDAERLLRDPGYCRSHTDRQLRELSKERKLLMRELWSEYR